MKLGMLFVFFVCSSSFGNDLVIAPNTPPTLIRAGTDTRVRCVDSNADIPKCEFHINVSWADPYVVYFTGGGTMSFRTVGGATDAIERLRASKLCK